MMEPARYCREIETYLCQKNDGHLIRIVGPAFEQVCGWAERGVPLKVAFRGIDRYVERYYAKGNRRRPVRIEFCEADVLDAFDDWRRAVGVTAIADSGDEMAETNRKAPLASHIERAAQRLRAIDAAGSASVRLQELVRATIVELETLADDARTARGDKRARLVDRLSTLDKSLIEASLAEIDAALEAELAREAEAELAPFGARMAPDVREKSLVAAYHRLVREALAMPTLSYE
jgi:hypothetical protein